MEGACGIGSWDAVEIVVVVVLRSRVVSKMGGEAPLVSSNGQSVQMLFDKRKSLLTVNVVVLLSFRSILCNSRIRKIGVESNMA